MIKIEKYTRGLIASYVFFFFFILLWVLMAIMFTHESTIIEIIIWAVLCIIQLSCSILLVIYYSRSYSLTDSGITRCSIFRIKKQYDWSEYPYCYLVWMTGTMQKLLLFFVFSKVEITEQMAWKWNKVGLPLVKPYTLIIFPHSPELEKMIRESFPKLKFEYRNESLQRTVCK